MTVAVESAAYRKSLEHFNFVVLHYEVSELALEAGGPHNMVVNPMVVAAPWFAEDDAVVLESMLFEPSHGHVPVSFGAGGEKSDDMAFLVPFVHRRF